MSEPTETAAIPNALEHSVSEAEPLKGVAVEYGRRPPSRDTIIDGTPVHAYADNSSSEGSTAVYIGTQTDLPLRLLVVNGGKTDTIDYYAYGAKVTITLPSCG